MALIVTGAGADGVSLRAEPSTSAPRVKVLRDGARLTDRGEERQVDNRRWKRVADETGAEGWIAADFVTAQGASPPVAGKPEASSDVQAYASYMSPKIESLAVTLAAIGELSTQMGRNPQVLNEPTFRVRMAAAIVSLRTIGEELQKYEPVPPRLKSLDDLMVSMGKDYVAAATDLTVGLDQLNANRLTSAATRIQSATAKMERARSELARVQSQQS